MVLARETSQALFKQTYSVFGFHITLLTWMLALHHKGSHWHLIREDSKFDEKKSLTYTPTEQNFTIPYGSGNVSGTYGTDKVSFGGVSVKNKPVGLAGFSNYHNKTIPILNTSPDAVKYEDFAYEGILGMSFPSLSRFNNSKGDGTGYGGLIFNMIDQKLISEPIFSIRTGNPNTMTNSGEIILGGIDSTQYTGSLLYSNVTPVMFNAEHHNTGDLASAYDNYFFWGSNISSITFQNNGATIDVGIPKQKFVTFDIGTSISFFPRKVVENILSSVVGPNGYIFDDAHNVFGLNCSSRHLDASIQLNLADFSNTSSSITISIPFQDLLYTYNGGLIDETDRCYFAIASSSLTPAEYIYLEYIVGSNILRFLYVVHDIGQKRIGFASTIGDNVTVY
ncbi:aspartic peptidase domain-containing protein [Phycomyces nitens]|nr:aspartic peptidase domain-containing protein [Phycomyces nitens]